MLNLFSWSISLQAYSNTTPIDEKEPITWARYFSYVDAYGYENLEQETSSLFLVIGYTNGVQMWCLGVSKLLKFDTALILNLDYF